MVLREREERRVESEAVCPWCGRSSTKHSVQNRCLRDLGKGGSVYVTLKRSCHRCSDCDKFFTLPADDVAEPGSQFTRRVKEKALRLVKVEGLSVDRAVARMRRELHVRVGRSTLYRWVGRAKSKR